jgi:hypothetical protein
VDWIYGAGRQAERQPVAQLAHAAPPFEASMTAGLCPGVGAVYCNSDSSSFSRSSSAFCLMRISSVRSACIAMSALRLGKRRMTDRN